MGGLATIHKVTTCICGAAVMYCGIVMISSWSFTLHTLQPIVNSLFLILFGAVKCIVSAFTGCAKTALKHFGFLESYAGHGCLKIFTGLMSFGSDDIHVIIGFLVVAHGFIDLLVHCCTRHKPDNKRSLLSGW